MNPDKQNSTLTPASSAPEDDIDREPTKEEITDDIRQGLRDMKAGYEGQDAREMLKELRQEIYGDADES